MADLAWLSAARWRSSRAARRVGQTCAASRGVARRSSRSWSRASHGVAPVRSASMLRSRLTAAHQARRDRWSLLPPVSMRSASQPTSMTRSSARVAFAVVHVWASSPARSRTARASERSRPSRARWWPVRVVARSSNPGVHASMISSAWLRMASSSSSTRVASIWRSRSARRCAAMASVKALSVVGFRPAASAARAAVRMSGAGASLALVARILAPRASTSAIRVSGARRRGGRTLRGRCFDWLGCGRAWRRCSWVRRRAWGCRGCCGRSHRRTGATLRPCCG
ncbi:hypothetical protein BH23ACT2_BH23ACT2_30850 [soil metagenome]